MTKQMDIADRSAALIIIDQNECVLARDDQRIVTLIDDKTRAFLPSLDARS